MVRVSDWKIMCIGPDAHFNTLTQLSTLCGQHTKILVFSHTQWHNYVLLAVNTQINNCTHSHIYVPIMVITQMAYAGIHSDTIMKMT